MTVATYLHYILLVHAFILGLYEGICGFGERPVLIDELVRSHQANVSNLSDVVASRNATHKLELVVRPVKEGKTCRVQ